MKVLTYDFDGGDLLTSIERWEALIKQYDGLVAFEERLQDRVKVSTIISRMQKGSVQDHFLVNVGKYQVYDQLRKDLMDVLAAKKHLGGTPDTGGGHTGPTPMEIGQLQGGPKAWKGKGNWSSRGKGDGGSKGKGKRARRCYSCCFPGHIASDCEEKKG